MALGLSVSAAALLLASGALAQESATAAVAPEGSFQVAQLSPPRTASDVVGQVVVTARRRTETLQSVPIAATVVGADALERQGVNTIQQLTALTPSAQVLSTNPRNTAITIRGLGASYGLANDGLEQGVGVYVDQVYNSRPASATFDFIDIERVEVLRGPQGTLFGKNTTAGALNITTRDPSFRPEVQAEMSYGNYNFLQAKASVSGPLAGDKLAGRISIVGTRRDGLVRNPVVGHEQLDTKNIALRGSLIWKPSDKLTGRFYIDFSRQEPECCTQLFVVAAPTLKPLNQQFAALAAGRGYVPVSTDPYNRLAETDGKIKADQTQQGVSAIFDYDFGPVTLTSVTAAREWVWQPANDRDYTPLDIIRQSANPSQQYQYSQELRLSSNGARTLDWQVGLFAFDQNVKTKGVTEYGKDASYWLFPAANVTAALLDGYKVFNTSSIDTKSYAAFGQATWSVTDKFKVTPGLRYTYEKKDAYYNATTAGGLATTDAALITRRLGIARPQFYTADISGGSLSGQLALAYQLTPDVNAYATYARGEKSGGINMAGIPTDAAGNPALNSAVVRPEKATTYEIGLKTQWFERRLTANLAAYYTTVRDFQANVVDSGPGALRGYLANIEKVTVKGVELDFATRPIMGVTTYAAVSWTDGEYSSFKNGPCPIERIGTATVACDLSGRELPGVSRWAGSAGAEYRHDASFGSLEGQIYASIDAAFRSPYYSDASTSIYTRLPESLVFNLRTGFKSSGNWDASFWVKNLFDEKYLQFVTIQTGNSGLVIGTPGDQRTVGVTLRARY
ncbi:MAG TPA: TonB-dependent receptor [Caulobacteraceae bacterium]|nr:TonB-dependent receptor [Caulobacteraceae bacterium]